MQIFIDKEVHYDILSLCAITFMFSFEMKRNADFYLYMGRKKSSILFLCKKKKV